MQEGFSQFGGVGRRFQVKGEVDGIMMVDDYGHHPTEIRATLAAAKGGWPTTARGDIPTASLFTDPDLFDEFVTAFYDADILVVTDISAAGEQPIEEVTAEALASAIRATARRM